MKHLAQLTLIALAAACAPSDADTAAKPAPPTKNGPREVAILGAGCFWGVEAWMAKAPGIVDIQVGYAGGASKTTTYHEVSAGTTGHAEVARIVFDPSVISYETLLSQYFFKIHDPTTKDRQGNDVGSQYRSAIFPQSKAQAATATKVISHIRETNAWKKPLTTTIEPNANYVAAEEYHQDYLIKHPGGYDNHFRRELGF